MTSISTQNKQPEVEKLKSGLSALLREARINEEKLVHLQAMEMRLLAADNFYEVCQVLVNEYRTQFNLHSVTITLLDRGRQMHEFLEEQQREDTRCALEQFVGRVNFVHDYKAIQELNDLEHKVDLGKYDERHDPFFPENLGDDIESVAILPLVRRGELLGFLSLGSVDPSRYMPDMATDFVDRLSSIVTLCIQNAIHLEKLKMLGLVDPLTKVRNRRYFFKRMGEEILRAQRGGTPIGCLYIDIDHFKKINDEHGHAAGDVALIHAVNVLQDAVRESDVIARLGGEEFAVILPDTIEQGATDVANRILEEFRKNPCELNADTLVPMTVSVGIAGLETNDVIAEPEVLADTIVEQADKALYQAKNRGRDCVVVYQAVN